ncbi:MAG: tripartite tricarboxylate transporter substrate binding protein [Pseudolabrys sp.]|nr:tripartite tricarboxylate transporter substrate binding protein [Pseudolabrys sp.]
MTIRVRLCVSLLVVLATCLSSALPSRAETYPARSVKIVVPFAAGGGTDLLARIIAQELSTAFDQPFVVENRPGAGTQLGTEVVARATADGYTLLSTSMTSYVLNPSLYAKLGYDPLKDFTPVTLTGNFTLVLIANPTFPAKSVGDLIAMAKAKPGTINFASSGPGSPHQLAMELLRTRAGADMVHIPYKGAAPALQDVIAGHVPVMITDYSSSAPAIRSGLVRAIAVASPERTSLLPDTPTIAEQGFPGYHASAWQGIVVPTGTPASIVDKLNAAIVVALKKPAVRDKLLAAGIEPLTSTPAEFAAYMRSEMQKWREVIASAHVVLQ